MIVKNNYSFCGNYLTSITLVLGLIRASILQRLIDFDMTQDALTPLMESKLRLTDLGKAVIEKWIYIPAYNEYTMHLAAVPNILISKFPRFYPERTDGPLAGNEYFEYLMAPEYIAKLFPTLSMWASLIAAIEFWEMTRFVLFKKNKSNVIPDNINFEFEPIIDKLVDNFNKTAQLIIYNEIGKKDSTILKKLAQAYNVRYDE